MCDWEHHEQIYRSRNSQQHGSCMSGCESDEKEPTCNVHHNRTMTRCRVKFISMKCKSNIFWYLKHTLTAAPESWNTISWPSSNFVMSKFSSDRKECSRTYLAPSSRTCKMHVKFVCRVHLQSTRECWNVIQYCTLSRSFFKEPSIICVNDFIELRYAL